MIRSHINTPINFNNTIGYNEDVFTSILYTVQDLKVSSVCKLWQQMNFKVIRSLLQEYDQQKFMARFKANLPNVTIIKDEDLTLHIKRIFLGVCRLVKNTDIQEKVRSLGVLELNFLIERVQVVEDESLINFFDDVRRYIPETDETDEWFLNIDDTSLDKKSKADAIRTWMEANPQILNEITELSFPDYVFRILPPEIGYFNQLQSLHLDQNRLKSLPESIGNLTKLQELDLHENHLTSLPESMGNLAQLQILNIDTNKLIALPESMSALTQLQELYLYDNQLTGIPETFSNLTQLQQLHLGNNHLEVVPELICNLTQLQWLDLAYNWLAVLPTTMGNLTQLKELKIEGNQLTALPDSMGNLTQLETLDIDENYLTALPKTMDNFTLIGGFKLSLYHQEIAPLKKMGNLTQAQIRNFWDQQFSVLHEIDIEEIEQFNDSDWEGFL